MRALVPAAAALAALALAAPAAAAPRPKPASSRYDLDLLGFNDGDPYLLRGAAAEAVLADPGAVVWRFDARDWMSRRGEGRFVRVVDVVSRYPERPATELVAVYGVDLDADRVPEMVLVPDAEALADGRRYAPTVLGVDVKGGYRPLWAADKLPGERYRVVDIRNLNADGRPEVLLAGEAGRSGYYQFHELVGRSDDGFRSLAVKHVDSIHYLDLDGDRRIEIVVRERVGRRGPAYQWTYVDHLYQWDGQRFGPADERFPRYHDVETLPTLVGDLIDHYEAKEAILEEKVDAIRMVRQQTLARTPRPSDLDRRMVPALAALQKDQMARARPLLEALDASFPYEPQVLVGLAQIQADEGDWPKVFDYAVRALTVDPRSRRGWWWAGVALVQLEERSSALASFHNLVRLGGSKDEGLAFLRARRGEPGMEGSLQRVIDQAIAEISRD